MGMSSKAMDLGVTWRIETDVFIDTFKYFIKHISFDLEKIYFYWCRIAYRSWVAHVPSNFNITVNFRVTEP